MKVCVVSLILHCRDCLCNYNSLVQLLLLQFPAPPDAINTTQITITMLCCTVQHNTIQNITNSQNQMNLLMNQRKVCQHPYLFGEPRDSKGEYVGVSSPETLVQVSGKLALLDRLLKRLKTEGHKVSASHVNNLLFDRLHYSCSNWFCVMHTS
jgi:SNF2 family DNA or RNA helicase